MTQPTDAQRALMVVLLEQGPLASEPARAQFELRLKGEAGSFDQTASELINAGLVEGRYAPDRPGLRALWLTPDGHAAASRWGA